eukprot:scaffold4545_cov111-Isochrysis_galbana.AAC.1
MRRVLRLPKGSLLHSHPVPRAGALASVLSRGQRASSAAVLCASQGEHRAVARAECVKQASVTSIEAMQPSGCRGVQAGRQAEAGCSCALRWQLRPPGFARSRGGGCKAPEAIRMLW